MAPPAQPLSPSGALTKPIAKEHPPSQKTSHETGVSQSVPPQHLMEERGTCSNAVADATATLQHQEKESQKSRSLPLTAVSPEQENVRQENMIQFAATELGATIIRPSKGV